MLRSILLGAVLAVAPASGSVAALLDFDFSFTNTIGANETVTGIVRGLTNNADTAASSVEILTNSGAFGTGEYVGHPVLNHFTVTNGAITDFFLQVAGGDNTLPDVTCCSLMMGVFSGQFEAGLTTSSSTPGVGSSSGLTFALHVPDVPLPAGLPLALTGVAGLAGLRLAARRRKGGRAA